MTPRGRRGHGAARGLLLAAALPLLVSACVRPPPPGSGAAAQPRYVVGEPYAMGGVWSYPREDFTLRETGLAVVAADRAAGRRTANGEIHDPALATAAHRTLQLPTILRVANLETGREILLRVNDRGPARAGRVLELSRRAAALLGVAEGGTAQLALSVEAEPSRRLAAALPQPEGTRLAIAAAPRDAVQSEELAPPPGSSAAPGRARPGGAMPAAAPDAPLAPPPERLPETVWQGPARPGRLYLQGSSFLSRADAQRQAARIGARVEGTGRPGRPEYRVRLGPFASIAEADTALERALRSGVSDARILID
ncbi:septal ring lytic transglycosylase RlpA family protein [Teichococcus rhizosphaerae]|nr:SPOR domain-containing protein [Pseudoroseomonas rhizosphaerae]